MTWPQQWTDNELRMAEEIVSLKADRDLWRSKFERQAEENGKFFRACERYRMALEKIALPTDENTNFLTSEAEAQYYIDVAAEALKPASTKEASDESIIDIALKKAEQATLDEITVTMSAKEYVSRPASDK